MLGGLARGGGASDLARYRALSTRLVSIASVSLLVGGIGIFHQELQRATVELCAGARVSAVVGIAFAYLPARRASRLDPIEAPRGERAEARTIESALR